SGKEGGVAPPSLRRHPPEPAASLTRPMFPPSDSVSVFNARLRRHRWRSADRPRQRSAGRAARRGGAPVTGAEPLLRFGPGPSGSDGPGVSSSTGSALVCAAVAAPAAAAGPNWANRSVTLPATHTPGTVVRPVGSAGRYSPTPV